MRARILLAALAAAVVGATPAVAAPTPPSAIRAMLTDPVFVVSLPADGGAWTVWSGGFAGDPWYAVSSPRAGRIGAGQCPPRRKAVTTCLSGVVLPGWTVVVGRVRPALSVEGHDGAGRPLRTKVRGGGYIALVHATPERVVVLARDASGRVVGRLRFRP